jgi:putative salt-induced outer membrane protein YdiY
MKNVLFTLALCSSLFVNVANAKPNFMRSLYMADKPNYKADEELSMVGEFGFIVANGNTNASTLKARVIANQELEAWEYQITGDTFYKQSSKKINGESVKATSAQKLFLSAQADYKLLDPNNRIFVYAEYEEKRFSGFDYQAAFATGWSSRLWRDTKSELKYSLGPG